jgi:hypothetical protein
MALPVITRALRRNVTPQALADLETAPLLPLLLGLSQVVSSGVSRSRRVADGLVLRGTRRLQELQTAAPRLLTSLEQLFPDNVSARLRYTAEEVALIRALIEFFLGWVLHLLDQVAGSQTTGSSSRPRWIILLHSLALLCSPRRHRIQCPTPA